MSSRGAISPKMFRRGVCDPGRRRRSPRNVRCGDCPDSCVRSAWTVWSRAEPRGGTHIVMHVVEIIVESRSVKRAACGGTVAAAILEAGARTVAGGTATNDDGSARPQPRQHACRHDRRPVLHAARCTLHAARIGLLGSAGSETRVRGLSHRSQPAAEDRGRNRLAADQNSNADEAYGPVVVATPRCHLASFSVRGAVDTCTHGGHWASVLARLAGGCRLRLRFWKLDDGQRTHARMGTSNAAKTVSCVLRARDTACK
jgi:hypothetical protein